MSAHHRRLVHHPQRGACTPGMNASAASTTPWVTASGPHRHHRAAPPRLNDVADASGNDNARTTATDFHDVSFMVNDSLGL